MNRVKMRPTLVGIAAVGLAVAAFGGVGKSAPRAEKKIEGASAPKGAHVLFAGKEEELRANWVKYGSEEPPGWKIVDGAMEVQGGDIASKETFGDYWLHIEFREPESRPEEHGQERGNSGVFLSRHYEIQVLDSYGIAEPGRGDCGAVYNQAAPLVNACKPPLQWQTYDILYRAPRADANHKITEHARVTVFQNGMLIQNNQEIVGPTDGHEPGPDEDFSQPAPIRIQDHGHPLRYRNVWVLPLPPHGAEHY